VVWWCGFKDRDTATSDLKIKTRKDVDSAREEQDTLARSLSLSLSSGKDYLGKSRFGRRHWRRPSRETATGIS
jgi:hypothetical protein